MEALNKTGGHLTNTAKELHCSRSALIGWAKEDGEFAEAIGATRKKMLDDCITTAIMISKGIPNMKVDEAGRSVVVGWEVPPDSQMLRYLMGTLGRDEGFGESMQLTHTVDAGVDISRWIEKEIEEKQKAGRKADR